MEKKRDREQGGILGGVAELFDLPVDVVAGLPRLELIGNRQLYLEQVHESLMRYKVDAFGGADRAHSSFSAIQKAVNYSMTSFFTTGGIRGSRRHLDAFYPRSFNMGMRKEVYEALGGFSDMRYGEDIDFSINAVIFRALGSIISEKQISSSFSGKYGIRGTLGLSCTRSTRNH